MEKKKKLTYFERLKMLYDGKVSEEYLLHYGSYARKHTVETAAKAYFESALFFNTKDRKRAEKLGLI